MIIKSKTKFVAMLMTAGGVLFWSSGPAAADTLKGRVLGGGQPIISSTVTLWAASADAPKQLGEASTGPDGKLYPRYSPGGTGTASLYLIAKGGHNQQGGDNAAIALMTVIGDKPPATVTINEMTTVASVWTARAVPRRRHDQDRRSACALPPATCRTSLILATGGYGTRSRTRLNSTQTPTMANFATLSSVMAGCATAREGRMPAPVCSPPRATPRMARRRPTR